MCYFAANNTRLSTESDNIETTTEVVKADLENDEPANRL